MNTVDGPYHSEWDDGFWKRLRIHLFGLTRAEQRDNAQTVARMRLRLQRGEWAEENLFDQWLLDHPQDADAPDWMARWGEFLESQTDVLKMIERGECIASDREALEARYEPPPWSPVVYEHDVSDQSIELIRANECDDGEVSMRRSRFRAMWNEIQRLRAALEAEKAERRHQWDKRKAAEQQCSVSAGRQREKS